MSAFPFGGHPSFSHYLTWANQKAGCTVQTGYMSLEDGEAVSMTLITAPNGRHAIEVDLAQDERLVASVISHLDRRLGLKSPWSLTSEEEPKP